MIIKWIMMPKRTSTIGVSKTQAVIGAVMVGAMVIASVRKSAANERQFKLHAMVSLLNYALENRVN